MKKLNVFVVLAITGMTFQSCGGGETEKKDGVELAENINENNSKQVQVPEKASGFMVKAASGGLMEVELGRIAQDKAVNPRVKQFGAMMVQDHTQANTEMKVLANGKSVTLPPTLGEDHQEHVDNLRKKSGKEFDEAYMSMMVDDHKNDISEFEAAAKSDDADVKGFAEKTLPVLRKHLDSAQAISSGLKK